MNSTPRVVAARRRSSGGGRVSPGGRRKPSVIDVTILSALNDVPEEQQHKQQQEQQKSDEPFTVNLTPSEESDYYQTSSMYETHAGGSRNRSGSLSLSSAKPDSPSSSVSTDNISSTTTTTSSTPSITTTTPTRAVRIAHPDGGFSIVNDPKLKARREELLDSLNYFKKLSQPRVCPHCHLAVYVKEAYGFDGVLYHKLCAQCDGCSLHLVPATGTMHENKIYCRKCLQKEQGVTGYGYGNSGPFVVGGVNAAQVEADAGYYLRSRERSDSLGAGTGGEFPSA